MREVLPRACVNQLVSLDLVKQAQRREVVGYERSSKIIGVIMARHGDDQTVILRRQGKSWGQEVSRQRHHAGLRLVAHEIDE